MKRIYGALLFLALAGSQVANSRRCEAEDLASIRGAGPVSTDTLLESLLPPVAGPLVAWQGSVDWRRPTAITCRQCSQVAELAQEPGGNRIDPYTSAGVVMPPPTPPMEMIEAVEADQRYQANEASQRSVASPRRNNRTMEIVSPSEASALPAPSSPAPSPPPADTAEHPPAVPQYAPAAEPAPEVQREREFNSPAADRTPWRYQRVLPPAFELRQPAETSSRLGSPQSGVSCDWGCCDLDAATSAALQGAEG